MGTSIKTQSSTSTQSDIKYPDRFNVIFVNDDFTPMEFVIHLLVEIFNKNIQQAQEITLAVHNNGRAVAGTYNYEIAEQKAQESMVVSRHNGHPLKVMVERV